MLSSQACCLMRSVEVCINKLNHQLAQNGKLMIEGKQKSWSWSYTIFNQQLTQKLKLMSSCEFNFISLNTNTLLRVILKVPNHNLIIKMSLVYWYNLLSESKRFNLWSHYSSTRNEVFDFILRGKLLLIFLSPKWPLSWSLSTIALIVSSSPHEFYFPSFFILLLLALIFPLVYTLLSQIT